MLIRCSNCGGTFKDTEAKCPYCGNLYEPGAEREYMGKMENIRKNLDDVDDIVVSDFKSGFKRSLVVFGITALIFLALFGLIFGSILGSQKKEKEEILNNFYAKLDKIAVLDRSTTEWNQLYETSQYEEMCVKVTDSVLNTSLDVGFWKHYDFYLAYSDYMKGMECVGSTREYNIASVYDMSNALQGLFNLYARLYVDDYSDFSSADEEILSGAYEELKSEVMEVYLISEQDFEEIRIRLTDDDRKTYIGSSDCEAIAKERLGE